MSHNSYCQSLWCVWHLFLRYPTRKRSENVLELFHPIGLEKNEQDERPQAQNEAVRRVPVSLTWLLSRDRWGETVSK